MRSLSGHHVKIRLKQRAAEKTVARNRFRKHKISHEGFYSWKFLPLGVANIGWFRETVPETVETVINIPKHFRYYAAPDNVRETEPHDSSFLALRMPQADTTREAEVPFILLQPILVCH